MKIYEIKHLSFEYPDRTQALKDISLSIEEGEFIVVCGASGSGKSTFLKQLKSILRPSGTLSGECLFLGRAVDEYDVREAAGYIGYVCQSAREQVVTDKVWHELAFGLENIECDNDTIRRRVAEVSHFFGIQEWFDEPVSNLSGGQCQLLTLASVLVMQPRVLILDEPTSELDPIAAEDFLNMLHRINSELGITVIMSEHRLENVFEMCDRVICLDEGRLVCFDTPKAVCRQLREQDGQMFSMLPVPVRVWEKLMPEYENVPISIAQGRSFLRDYADGHMKTKVESDLCVLSDKSAVRLSEIWYRYSPKDKDVLKGTTLDVRYGEWFALVGGNGSGKSTMLSIISGIKKPQSGKVTVNGKTSLLPQNVKYLFVRKTVFEDMLDVCNDREKVIELMDKFSITHLKDKHSYDLSGGELMRSAIVKVLLTEPDILLLDEPTRGLDEVLKQELADILNGLISRGMTVVMVSHDLEFAAGHADRCAMFFDGKAVSVEERRKFFLNNSFYTTAAGRMSRNILENVVTSEDIINSFKVEVKKDDENAFCDKKNDSEGEHRTLNESRRISDETCGKVNDDTCQKQCKEHSVRDKNAATSVFLVMISLLIFLVAIPFTIYVGMNFLQDRKYLFISLLIILECMIPVYMTFEKKKRGARELVLIAVFVALAIASRVLFYMLPEFKPVTAMVILGGMAFGANAGFFIGSTTMLVSNIYFGQGPWTPWQMFAMGMVGFVAGIIFGRKKPSPAVVLLLSIYGFVSSVVIYGGIMNSGTAFMAGEIAGIESLIPYYMSGIVFDLIRAAATFLFLLILTVPVIDRLNRVLIKYC